ncbi:O-linked N-acetylglucosamine transferase family protein [Enterobacter cloacae]|uniref:O-linked N-acetylglucosamine transferase family protein n=1 Tax=Enterobacter cloacae TaxID=550 RepID=UPI00374EC76D
MFSLDLPQSFSLASVSSELPKSDSVAPYLCVNRIQASAWLYGAEGEDPHSARVLDLGCGDASHLLPFALSYPQARIIGIDLSPNKIEAGQFQMRLAGIDNIQLFCADLATILGGIDQTFDYIIIHNVFSLLDAESRKALFAFCRQHLSLKGIIAAEWLTQPGTGLAQFVRDAIALHTRDASNEEMQIESARAALTWLSLGMCNHPAREALAELIKEAEAMEDDIFALRYLHGMENATYFVDFHHSVEQSGLQYLGDLFPWKECPQHYGKNVAALSEAICPGQEHLLQQQYLDFSVNRRSRFSLLSGDTENQARSASPDLTRLRDLHWAGSFRRVVDGEGHVKNRLRSESGHFVATDDVVTLSVLDVVGNAWPLSLSFDQIVFHTHSPEDDLLEHENKVLLSLGALFMQDTVGLHFQRVTSVYNTKRSTHLESIFGRAFHQIKAGFNLWGEPVELTAQEVSILEKGDFLHADVKRIDELRRKGIMTGSPACWRAHFQRLITQVYPHELADSLLPLILFSSPPHAGGFEDALSDTVNKTVDKKDTQPVDQKLIDRMHALIAREEFAKARELARELTQKSENNPNAWLELSRVYSRTMEYAAAVRAICRTLNITSINWDIYFELSIALWNLEKGWLTGRVVRAILRANLNNGLAWNSLAHMYAEFQIVDKAEVCFEKALKIMPENSGVLSNYSALISEKLRMNEAIAMMRKAIQLSPSDMNLYSRLNFELSHSGECSPAELYEQHRVYGRQVEKWAKGQKTAFTWSADKNPERRLRIGFVSGDLCRHPVTWFLKPYWVNINRDLYELYVYNTSPIYDEVSETFAKTASKWRNVFSESSVELARIINGDDIDILLDLSGHTGYNRLPTFALKPAPVSIGWIGYPCTSGLKEMDYHICGTGMATPGELDDQFSEKLIFMSMPVQYEPPANSPDINPLPALSSGVFTFGSLNRPKKISDKVIEVWGRLLATAPQTRLLIGYMPSDDVIQTLRTKLEAHGARPDQLNFRMKTHFDEYMRMHHEIDLMLDTFPYDGGTTSNNAVWMGVPMITLNDKTMAGRQGNEIIKAYQLEQFLAADEDAYFEQALAWTEKREELNTIRLTMRERFEKKRNQVTEPARTFEATLRTVWENYCSGHRPKSFVVDGDDHNAEEN